MPRRGRVVNEALNEKIPIKIVEEGKVELHIPPFFATPSKSSKSQYKWKLVNPLSKIRNIAKRKGHLVIQPVRNLGVNRDQLLGMYDYATDTKFSPLLIDLEQDPEKRFRKGFSEILDPARYLKEKEPHTHS